MKNTLLIITALFGMLSFQSKASNYYLAGEFNNWQAGDPNYKFEQVEGENLFEFVYPEEIFEGEFKITTDTWQLSWGSYSRVFPNQWISLTTDELNNIYVWERGKIKNAKFIFDPSAERLLVEGEYITPPRGLGLYNEKNGIWPLEEDEGKPGLYHIKLKIENQLEFQIVYYEIETEKIIDIYGTKNGQTTNISLGEPNLFQLYGGKYSLEPGQYDLTLGMPYLIVTDAEHKAKDIYILQGGGEYGADYVYFNPAIFNFNLPTGTQFTQYVKMNGGEFIPYILDYADYGASYLSPFIPITPVTEYKIESYIEASYGGELLYKSETINLEFTSSPISLGFRFEPETDKTTQDSATIQYQIFSNLLLSEAKYEIEYICIDSNTSAPEVRGVFNTENSMGEFEITGLESNICYDLWLNVTMITEFGNLTVKTSDPGWFWTLEEAGVETIVSDDAPRYFNLNGMEVQNPKGGIYIEVLNGKTRKVIK